MNRRRPAPHIIRRRRIALLVIVALIFWGVWAGVSAVIGLFTGDAKKADVQACAPGVVSVTATIGDGAKHLDVIDANTNAYVWFTLLNNSKVACKFNTAGGVQFFRIKNAEQVVWTSEQCDRKNLEMNAETVLQPGKPAKSRPSEWRKVYSSGGGCGEGQAPALPGDYSLSVEVNKVVSGNYEAFTLQ